MAQSANIRTADSTVTSDAAHVSYDRDYKAGEAETPLTIGEVAREFGITLRALRFLRVEATDHAATRRYRPHLPLR
jgi:hypothetical protein